MKEKKYFKDVPELQDVIDYCNEFRHQVHGAMAATVRKVQCDQSKINKVLRGTEPVTSRNLEILAALQEILENEMASRAEAINKLNDKIKK